jgi:hypothetical protein
MPQIRLTLKTIKELKTPLLHDISIGLWTKLFPRALNFI